MVKFADALAAYDHLYRGAFGKIVIRIREQESGKRVQHNS
jgi:hypothetical protein